MYNSQEYIAAVTMRIRAYNATGGVDIRREPFILGTRVPLACDVMGLSNEKEVASYKWFHSLKGNSQERYEIQDREQ